MYFSADTGSTICAGYMQVMPRITGPLHIQTQHQEFIGWIAEGFSFSNTNLCSLPCLRITRWCSWNTKASGMNCSYFCISRLHVAFFNWNRWWQLSHLNTLHKLINASELPWPPSVVKKLPEVKSVVLRRVILPCKCTQVLTPTVKNPHWLQQQSFFRRDQQFFDGNQEHQWVWVQIMHVKAKVRKEYAHCRVLPKCQLDWKIYRLT